jgi:hypothetical protein
MACIGVCKSFLRSGSRVFQTSFTAVVLITALTLLGTRPAQAQNVDTWKSVAIIGGATAAGAYIGHKVGGRTGALVGAGVGGAAGYAIDRRRRLNQYNQYGYNNGGYYGSPDGYYGNGAYNGGNYDNGGYYGNPGGYYGPYDSGGYPYSSGYVSNNRPDRVWCPERH